MKEKCYHLYHSRTIHDTNKHENYNKNLNLVYSFGRMSKNDLENRIRETMGFFGDVNKYKYED